MSNNIKKIISGLMCMALLAVYAVPVNAAQYMDDIGIETAGACGHDNFDVTYVNTYTSANASQHHTIQHKHYTCTVCGHVRTFNYDLGLQAHSWTYRDLGHVGVSHNYEVVCRDCGHTERTSVPCNNKNGSHNTP